MRAHWLGGVEDEVQMSWQRLNEPGPVAAPAGPAWEAAQLALLRRVGHGESVFHPDDRHTAEAGERFDQLVEHVLAMQRC